MASVVAVAAGGDRYGGDVGVCEDWMQTILQLLSKEGLVMPPMVIAARLPCGDYVATSVTR